MGIYLNVSKYSAKQRKRVFRQNTNRNNQSFITVVLTCNRLEKKNKKKNKAATEHVIILVY